jgi:magnesium transporter
MLRIKKILFQIENNIESIIKEDTALGRDFWKILLEQHHADIAMLISKLDAPHRVALFKKLPRDLSIKVFEKVAEPVQAELLVTLDIEHAGSILKNMPVDELTDLFDHLSDENLEKYLKLLQSKQRNKIISLLTFNPRSAGGRMNSDVLTLQKDFTVRKSVELLQRIGQQKVLTQRLYVTTSDNVLVGYITLDKLVLNKPETSLSSILNKNEFVVYVGEDQEDVANQMHHYGVMVAPVVDKQQQFLGVITADDVFDIIKQEGSDDVYKMFGLIPVQHSYFATPVWQMVWQRGIWLVGLLLFQSFSSAVLASYDSLLSKYSIISIFLTMLIGTGGNAGNQSATLVIRGLTTKEMSRNNAFKVLFREFGVALIMACVLICVGFVRVYFSHHDLLSAIAISFSLFLIVIVSIISGSLIPLILDRFNIDPAHSAAPFLATLMDILGVIIYCFVCSKILG